MPTDRGKKLVGAVGALRTMTNDDYSINLDKQRRHLDWVIDQGLVEGSAVILIVAGGSEGYFMDDAEWEAEVEMAAATAAGRVPLCAGIFELSARAAVKKAKIAAGYGVDFIQVSPPHYMIPSDDEVLYHYQMLNDGADIGIMLYATPWAMPQPGWNFTPKLLDKLVELENVEGLKWSSFDFNEYIDVARLFHDRLNLINNASNTMSLAPKLGFKGFINSDGLVAPRLVLHMYDLWKQKKYDEFDDLILKLYIDPFLGLSKPEDIAWRSMGEGPNVRMGMETLGMNMGPSFPAQLPLSDDSWRQRGEGVKSSGLMEWVDWKDEYAEAEEAADD
jgi:dihydrodipicolinate synthase/N-acetylneuraminate lyase